MFAYSRLNYLSTLQAGESAKDAMRSSISPEMEAINTKQAENSLTLFY